MRVRPCLLLVLVGCASSGGSGGRGGDPLPTAGPASTTTTIVTPATGAADVKTYRDDRAVATTINAPADRVWGALFAALQELEIPPGTVDTRRRLYGHDAVEPKNGRIAGMRVPLLLNCGTSSTGVPLAQTYRVRLSVNSVVVPEGDVRARVETRVGGSAASTAVSGTSVACGSTGALEKRIAELVKERAY